MPGMVPPVRQGRPKSRQSTTSIASTQAQPILQQEHSFVTQSSGVPTSVWQQQQHDQVMAQISQQFPEGYASMMGTMPHSIVTHQPIGFPIGGAPPLQMHPAFSHPQSSLQNRDSPMSDIGMETGNGGTKNATNDNELRRLLRENEDRTLDSIAQQFQKDEPTSKLEKLKQIFGMVW